MCTLWFGLPVSGTPSKRRRHASAAQQMCEQRAQGESAVWLLWCDGYQCLFLLDIARKMSLCSYAPSEVKERDTNAVFMALVGQSSEAWISTLISCSPSLQV